MSVMQKEKKDMNQVDLKLLADLFGAENVVVVDEETFKMKGTVARVMADKRFGFIRGQDGVDYFFHQSDLNGFFDDLVADIATSPNLAVTFDVAPSEKGPRASN